MKRCPNFSVLIIDPEPVALHAAAHQPGGGRHLERHLRPEPPLSVSFSSYQMDLCHRRRSAFSASPSLSALNPFAARAAQKPSNKQETK